MLGMEFRKELQLLQILNDLSTKYLIKLILCEIDVKLLEFERMSVSVNLWCVLGVRFWLLIPEINRTKSGVMVYLFFYSKFNVSMLLI